MCMYYIHILWNLTRLLYEINWYHQPINQQIITKSTYNIIDNKILFQPIIVFFSPCFTFQWFFVCFRSRLFTQWQILLAVFTMCDTTRTWCLCGTPWCTPTPWPSAVPIPRQCTQTSQWSKTPCAWMDSATYACCGRPSPWCSTRTCRWRWGCTVLLVLSWLSESRECQPSTVFSYWMVGWCLWWGPKTRLAGSMSWSQHRRTMMGTGTRWGC